MLEFLAACVRGRMNIVISGGTSSGKTTLLGALSSFVSAHGDLGPGGLVRLSGRARSGDWRDPPMPSARSQGRREAPVSGVM
jgi:predicted ATPase